MRIALFGPAHPYKGGIVHYMTLLARELRRRDHAVEFFGFTRQFPEWFYPGESDIDPSSSPLREETRRTLDSLNPWSWSRTGELIATGQPDVTIVSWWTAYLAPHYLAIFKQLRRNSRTKVIVICHNVVDHEPHWIKTRLTRATLRRVDALITHSNADSGRLREIAPDVTCAVVPHPNYDSLLPAPPTRESARRSLGWSGPTLLFLGYVRKYKGLEYLLQSLPLIREKLDVQLVVAGEFWERLDHFQALARELGVSAMVRFVPGYVENERAAQYLAAADVLVLPYVTGTQSGIVQLAYAAGLPVIASRVGGFAQAVEDGVSGYLVEPRRPAEIAEAVIDFYARNRAGRLRRGVEEVRQRFTWDRLIEVVEAIHAGTA